MTREPQRPRADLVGAGLVALAAACFGTLGPLSRFAGDAGVDSLTLVTWRAALGAAVVGMFMAVRFAVAGVRTRSLRSLPARDRWLGRCWRHNLVFSPALFGS